MHPPVDPRLETVLMAIRARGGNGIRSPGARPTTTLGTGNAVFMGGISVIDPAGEVRVLRKAQSAWIWPAMIGGVWALIVTLLALVADGPPWLVLALIALITVVLGPIALLALVLASRARRRRLVIDARTRTLEELDGTRTALQVSGDLMSAVRVQSFASGEDGTMYDVLIRVGSVEMWIHQEGSAGDAAELAQILGGALGVRFDPQVQHHP